MQIHRDEMWQCINDGKIWKGELINYCTNGKQYWAEATIVPLLTNNKGQKQFFAIQNEITERKELERKLVESKYKLEQAMEIAAFGVLGGQYNFRRNLFIKRTESNI